jgi:hypothetical protein
VKEQNGTTICPIADCGRKPQKTHEEQTKQINFSLLRTEEGKQQIDFLHRLPGTNLHRNPEIDRSKCDNKEIATNTQLPAHTVRTDQMKKQNETKTTRFLSGLFKKKSK